MRHGSLCGMLRGASSNRHMPREGGCAVIRQAHLIAVVLAFLIGCAVILMAGASGGQAEASKKEVARCEGTRKINGNLPARFTTNDLPGCPQGGLLLGTDKADVDSYPDHPGLDGQVGDDEIRGLGGNDSLSGGDGKDVLYGGPGEDRIDGGKGEDVIYGGDGNDISKEGPGTVPMLDGGPGEDMIYGGDGNDSLAAKDGQRDKLYCGKGKDGYFADKNDYVDSSCEVPVHPPQCCAA